MTLDASSECVALNTGPEETCVRGDFTGHYLDKDGVPTKIPEAPDGSNLWDSELKQWVYCAKTASKDVSVSRAKSYPKISDQLDMLWHAMDSGLLPSNNDFYSSIKSVKDANPKPITKGS